MCVAVCVAVCLCVQQSSSVCCRMLQCVEIYWASRLSIKNSHLAEACAAGVGVALAAEFSKISSLQGGVES